MLILARRVGETLILDDGVRQVRITVIGVRGNKVRIALEAPRDVEIRRHKIGERIKRKR
jgi:carbon storage regulator